MWPRLHIETYSAVICLVFLCFLHSQTQRSRMNSKKSRIPFTDMKSQPFGEIHHLEGKTDNIRDSCRSDEKMFFFVDGGRWIALLMRMKVWQINRRDFILINQKKNKKKSLNLFWPTACLITFYFGCGTKLAFHQVNAGRAAFMKKNWNELFEKVAAF